MSLSYVLTQATTEQVHEIPMSAEAFGVLALVVFGALLGLTWTFRNTSNKRH